MAIDRTIMPAARHRRTMTERTETIDVTRPFNGYAADLAPGETFDFDPADGPGGGPTILEVNQIAHGTHCDVRFLADPDGDGTYEVDILLNTLTPSGISEDRAIRLFETDNEILRLENVGDESADFAVSSRVLGGLA